MRLESALASPTLRGRVDPNAVNFPSSAYVLDRLVSKLAPWSRYVTLMEVFRCPRRNLPRIHTERKETRHSRSRQLLPRLHYWIRR
jgi:hypothetical protein